MPDSDITSWFPLLGWSRLPNFGHVLNIDNYDDFSKNYFTGYQLNRLKKNLFITLTGRYQAFNLRIMGAKGTGKTSFFYYLKMLIKHEPELVDRIKPFIYIFHANNSVADDSVIEKYILEYILDAWIKFYETNGFNDLVNSYKELDIPLKEKTNKLKEYYKNNRSKFDKLFIFIIDDVDKVKKEEHVVEIAEHVFRHLEIDSVKKWLVIREPTYKHYKSESMTDLNSKFPKVIEFPFTSLYTVINHRIESMGGKNPFSDDMCEIVEDIRERFKARTWTFK